MIDKKLLLLSACALTANSLNSMLQQELLLLHAQLSTLSDALQKATPSPAATTATSTSTASAISSAETKAASATAGAETKATGETQALSTEERKKIVDLLQSQMQILTEQFRRNEDIKSNKTGEGRISPQTRDNLVAAAEYIIEQSVSLVQRKMLMPLDQYVANTYITEMKRIKEIGRNDVAAFNDNYKKFYNAARSLVYLLTRTLDAQTPKTVAAYWKSVATVLEKKSKGTFITKSERELINAGLVFGGGQNSNDDRNYVAIATTADKDAVSPYTPSVIVGYLNKDVQGGKSLADLTQKYNEFMSEEVNRRPMPHVIIPVIREFYKDASKIALKLAKASTKSSAPATAGATAAGKAS